MLRKNIELGDLMTNELKEKLEKWQKAKLDVADNARIMSGKTTEADVQFCADGMKRLYSAKEQLADFCKSNKNLPSEISDWFAALSDPGCGHCWITSDSVKPHSACQDKIDRYFAAEEALQGVIL